MSHSVSITSGYRGYKATCTCGWKSEVDQVRAVVEYQVIAHRRTTRDFDPEPDTIDVIEPDENNLPRGCMDAVCLVSLVAELVKIQKTHMRLHGTLGDTPCLRKIEFKDGNIIAHVSVGPVVNDKRLKLVLEPDGSWKEEEND